MKIQLQLNKTKPLILPIIFIILFTIIAFHRHLNLQSTMFDLGLMHQRVWTTLHGVYMHISLSRPTVDSGNSFVIENAFRPILNLFVPIYSILPDPKVLIFAQVFSVAIGSIPIYLYAKYKLQSGTAALIFQTAYFIYPQTLNSTLFDFHPMTFSISFLSWGFYLLLKQKTLPAIILLILSMFSREAIAFTISAIGLYIIFLQRKLKVGLILIALGISYFLFVFLFLYKFFGLEEVHPYFSHPTFENYTRYEWLGSDLTQITNTIITRPSYVLHQISQPAKLHYISTISSPFLYLNLLSPMVLTTIPNILVNLFSEKRNMYSGAFHYESTMIPFFFFSAILSLSLIKNLKWIRASKKRPVFRFDNIILALIVSSFISQFLKFSSPLMPRERLKMLISGELHISSHAKKIKSIKQLINENDSISTQNNLGPHFASRMNIYSFPNFAHQSDYVLVDFHDPYLNRSVSFPCPVCIHPISLEEFNQNVRQMFEDENYGVYLFDDGYLLFKNKHPRDLNEQTFSRIQHLISDNYFQTP